MNKTIEIELRYEVMDRQQILAFLSCAKLLNIKHDVDIYLDTPNRNLWKRGIFIRIRNEKKLDIKFNRECFLNTTIDHLDYCEEHSFALPLKDQDLDKINELLVSIDLLPIKAADFVAFKSANKLEEHYVIDKVRSSYNYKSFTIGLDEIADLGTFLEIELMAYTADGLEKVKQEMQFLLFDLKLKPIGAGYSSLMLKKNDFDCYVQGRYALKEDKNRCL